ncbi:ribosylnicotinamide kinase [Lambiella insularis]|nr:ribosylnicotinamide kinase [Lambiella insularis]
MHILQSLVPSVFTIQQDDFNKEIEDLPIRPNGIPVADSVESTDIPRLVAAVLHAKDNGTQARVVATSKISEKKSKELRERLSTAVRGQAIVVVEGWLLYQNLEIRKIADVKLFLRTSKLAAKRRRMNRPGYGDPGTSDFWRTEEYFEECV